MIINNYKQNINTYKQPVYNLLIIYLRSFKT